MGNQSCCQHSSKKISELEVSEPHFPDLIDTARKQSISSRCRVSQSVYEDDILLEHPLTSRHGSSNSLSLRLDSKRDNQGIHSPDCRVKRHSEINSSIETRHHSFLHASPTSADKRSRNNRLGLGSLEELLEPVMKTENYAVKLNHTISQAFVNDYDKKQLESLLTSFERTLSARDVVSRQNFDLDKEDAIPTNFETDQYINECMVDPEYTFAKNKSQRRPSKDLKIDLSFMESRVVFDTSAPLKSHFEESPQLQTKNLARSTCTPRFTIIHNHEGALQTYGHRDSQDSVDCFSIDH